jgi:hypothetical protein
MSTRWQIAAKLSDGRCGCIYVHCDGYPRAAMAMLVESYSDQTKIEQLIALGDCLSVDAEIGRCDPFASRADEDWEDIKPTYGNDLKAVADEHRHGDEEYRYFWDGEQWAQAQFDAA